jgi:hypothetical protein
MNEILSVTYAFALSLALLLSVSTGTNLIYGQQNQTSNMTSNQPSGAMSNQSNQTGIGTEQQIESLTPPSGGVGQQQEGGQLGIIGGLEKQTAGNETVGGLRTAGNATGEALQTAANETGELLGGISERVQGFFN